MITRHPANLIFSARIEPALHYLLCSDSFMWIINFMWILNTVFLSIHLYDKNHVFRNMRNNIDRKYNSLFKCKVFSSLAISETDKTVSFLSCLLHVPKCFYITLRELASNILHVDHYLKGILVSSFLMFYSIFKIKYFSIWFYLRYIFLCYNTLVIILTVLLNKNKNYSTCFHWLFQYEKKYQFIRWMVRRYEDLFPREIWLFLRE